MCMHHEEPHPGPSRRGLLLGGGALAATGLLAALGGAERALAWSQGDPLATEAKGASAQGAQAAPGRWARPLTARHPVSAAYGIKGDWLAGHHTGIDFAVNTGTPVYSVGPGTVDVAGGYGDYGQAVLVRMDDGHFILYAHLSTVAVRVGNRTDGGRRLGSSGATGRVTGPHLHFEVRTTRNYGTDVNPTHYLAERGVQLV